MRTKLKLDPDVAAEVERLCREEGIGINEAVNRLIRSGMARAKPAKGYEHRSVDLGLRVDVANTGDALELLDESG